jgi:[FeFe] hydrogenase H-cluster maturation GTPase HydF
VKQEPKLNSITDSSRPRIAVVGRRNVGKALLVKSLLGQNISDVPKFISNTTNLAKETLELIPYGPVVIMDTAGIDDEDELGSKKITETIQILSSSDFALVVVDARETLQSKELELLAYLDKLQINYVVAVNKIEFGVNQELLDELKELRITHFEVSCKEKAGIDELKRKIIRLLPYDNQSLMLDGIITKGKIIVLVVPTELHVPRRKLVLSHAQLIREVLDEHSTVIICKEIELRSTIDNLKSYPDLIISDSRAFLSVAAIVPDEIKLTTFSILMTCNKSDLPFFVGALRRIEELKNGDRILIAEACSHHDRKDEINSIMIPRWLHSHTKMELNIDVIHNLDFPSNLSDYRLIIHCNGCMLSRRAMRTRINEAKLMDIPIINYGVLESYMNGAFPRALIPFKDAEAEWNKFN